MTTPIKRGRGRPRCRLENAVVSLSIPVTMKKRIHALSADEGLSVASWIRRLVLREFRRLQQTSEAA